MKIDIQRMMYNKYFSDVTFIHMHLFKIRTLKKSCLRMEGGCKMRKQEYIGTH